jgi:hypothetical protein
MTWRIPVDSAEAAELRERPDDDQPVLHASRCSGGWLGEDTEGRPIPCLQCRTHLARDRKGVSTP